VSATTDSCRSAATITAYQTRRIVEVQQLPDPSSRMLTRSAKITAWHLVIFHPATQ
jgi:hypothetical protein